MIVYGANWCPDCDRVKRLLIRNEIDFRYINIDEHGEAVDEVVALAGGKRTLPVVRVGGETLVNPSSDELNERLGGVETTEQENVYDVVIVGAGTTGLSSAIYTTRERLKTIVVEKAIPGGQILTTARVENYPGFPDPIGGWELTDRLVTQATRFGAEIRERTGVTAIEPRGDEFLVHLAEGEPLHGRTVILAPGSQYRKLNVPGETELTGYGVSFCGTCDAPFYRDKHVVAVGGGNTAIDEGLHLLKFVSRLTVVQDKPELTASPFLVEELAKHGDRVEVLTGHRVERIEGTPGEHVTGVVLKNLDTGQARPFACDGVFIWIGLEPNTGFLEGGPVELDLRGFIVADNCQMQTRTPGLFAAGDVRSGSRKQIATAAGEGVIAALVASEYLKRQKTPAS